MRVLIITSQWPTKEHPEHVPFLVREVAAISNLGVSIDVFHYKGGFRTASYLSAVAELHQRLQNQQYDLLHGQFGIGGLPALFTNYPLVVTFQGSDLNGIHGSNGNLTLSGLMLRTASQIVALRAHEIILVSNTLSRYLPRKHYHVIPGGVDLEKFRPVSRQIAREILKIRIDKKYVLFAGGIRNPIKRYELASRAIAILKTECHDVEMLVANGVPPDEMPLYLNASDVVLLTSSREGSPNIVKEALACNRPVVSVDVGDVRDRIGNLNGCAVSESNTPESIAEALWKVLQFQEPFQGRQSILSLDIHAIATRIVNVYRKVTK
jgi:glycosyltransferase involved in cell wall biosynthesis